MLRDNVPNACDTCASTISSELLSHYLELEPMYADRVNSIDKHDTTDVLAVLKEALNLFSDSHWVIYTLETMLSESLKTTTLFPARIDLLLRRLEYLKRIFPMANYTTAWLLEELGDCYADKFQSIAATYYERAYWTLRIMCGQDHPFTESAQTKWDSMLPENETMSKPTDSIIDSEKSYA
jgi:hypothetical protein